VSTDADYMGLAVALGRKALGRTGPNPCVGAVVVAGNRIVGRGYHHRAGGPHGEIEALRDAGARARGATLYVTLEPCNHHGRTPPCTDAIVAAGVTRVVFGVRDPNPHVRRRRRGRGCAAAASRSRAASRPTPAPSCTPGSSPWRAWGGRSSRSSSPRRLDGRIATRSGARAGSPARRRARYVHRLRSEHDAIMVGAGTVIADDPQLTARIRAAAILCG
jgi:diaminohydroxyphosphoribosylaminopyrimidine deaminase/5-amino-6-(5-phosphoribosylamino)uracil reductase